MSKRKFFRKSLLMFAITIGAVQLRPQQNGPPQLTTIYEVQFTTDPSGDSPYVGHSLIVRGVVTGAFPDGFTMAEAPGPWHSIFVFTKKCSPSLGDEMLVTGTVKEFNGLTELVDVSALSMLGSGGGIEATIVSAHSAAEEEYESVLIKVLNATVTSLDLFGEWTIQDNSGSLISDDKNDYLYFPRLGDHLASITGVLFYYNNQYKLEPRFTLDIDCPAIPHYAIWGDFVTMNGRGDVLANAYVEIRGDKIVGISATCPGGVTVYGVDGYIFPGMIDAHNHPQWNVLGRIPFEGTFTDRYEWQNTALYEKVQEQFSDVMNYGGQGAQQANLFKLAEVRALCSGTTTIQGFNCSDRQYDSFARQGIVINNAERFPGLVYTDVFPLTRASGFWQQRDSEYWRRFAIHLAEGSSEVARQEFDAWSMMNMLDSRSVIIHGVPLGRSEFSQMARVGAHLVWSPGSNWLLYGATADVPTALAAGVNVALAPDWTESGMPDVLLELKFAHWLSEKLWGGRIKGGQLVEFVTCNAARALGLEDRVGSIAVGMNADLVVVPKLHRDPYLSLLSTESADVKLTIVNGRPIVGEPALMNQFPFLEGGEEITVGGKTKIIVLRIGSHSVDQSNKPLSTIMGELVAAYAASNPKVCAFLSYDHGSSNPLVDIAIDVLPGIDPNVVNLKGAGVVAVAILTTVAFDATTVSPLTVRFGPSGAREMHAKGHIQDVDGDGDLDMLLHFEMAQTGLGIGQSNAALTGRTIWGQGIAGTAAVYIVTAGAKQSAAGIEGPDAIGALPMRYNLCQNYPNPFNPTTILAYELPSESKVIIRVYNNLGQIVSTLVDAVEGAGSRRVTWDAGRLPSGIYFCRMDAVCVTEPRNSVTQMKPMVLVR